jgi:hypothetical protein
MGWWEERAFCGGAIFMLGTHRTQTLRTPMSWGLLHKTTILHIYRWISEDFYINCNSCNYDLYRNLQTFTCKYVKLPDPANFVPPNTERNRKQIYNWLHPHKIKKSTSNLYYAFSKQSHTKRNGWQLRSITSTVN